MIARRAILALLLLQALLLPMMPQAPLPEYNDLWFYRVWFTDKSAQVSDYSPDELLSPAAIARRMKWDIPLITWSDLPVSSSYVAVLAADGLIPWVSSRWLNTCLLASAAEWQAADFSRYPFVDRAELVKRPSPVITKSLREYGITARTPGMAADPRLPHNGNMLHRTGLTGRGVTIAVLDGGFSNADRIESLEPLRQRGGIIATYDFVRRSPDVYEHHTHGTAVLSILAGQADDRLCGTAPGADYILLRTEDGRSEYPVEEDYWVAAAEYADSIGADIITSSLGYSEFDDPAMSYSFSRLDGRSTFITRGANTAASKGILVLSSAGNERSKPWIRIVAPSDGTGVIGVGALNPDLTIAGFSSAGYSADGRVKPDVVAPGVNITLQIMPGQLHSGSGTSFSCPVIAGLAASLMQAVPAASPREMTEAILRSSDRYSRPDSLYGYGIPDFVRALEMLEEVHAFKPEAAITAGPNPFTGEIMIWFGENPQSVNVTLTGTDGKVMLEKRYQNYVSRSLRLEGLGPMSQGVYLLRVATARGEKVFKMIRAQR